MMRPGGIGEGGSANHTTTTKNPELSGTPNSSIDIVDSVGNIKT